MKRSLAAAMSFFVLLVLQQQLPAQQTRTEKDLLGEQQIDTKAYYGVQTARALENFTISGVPTSFYPDYVKADWIHSAQSLTKVSTTVVQTFMSPLNGHIGISNYGVNEFYRYPYNKFGTASDFSVDNVTQLPRVDIIYGDVDLPADLIDAYVEKGEKGIVIAGVGNFAKDIL